ncbi:hypothetical protein FRACYDRAFT_235810 [Fragilariopsis cylindrus CCMP1102]|uniref:Uncharacterized protein n=1 Tax=Fragilariopsis cylindrus CCMP1102 TaxID=635003 RepID=A0A1E7FPM3_9STRA|nr:hypothetical protein FRACYDRAFT_235810 [Fragilariopsis cylindrus CCMP1102]|eukprot:OEU19753.1 hypothetical protein FRACYDRAFT_235810 [Fragilariopsis cylindrus CCMP1102]
MKPTPYDTIVTPIDQGWKKKRGFGPTAFIVTLLVLSAFLVGRQNGTNNRRLPKQMLRAEANLFGALLFENSAGLCDRAPSLFQKNCECAVKACSSELATCFQDASCAQALTCLTNCSPNDANCAFDCVEPQEKSDLAVCIISGKGKSCL